MSSRRTVPLLLLLLVVAAQADQPDQSMPNPINSCGKLSMTVTTVDEGQTFDGPIPPQGYPATKLEASRIMESMSYNIKDYTDITKPSAGMGSSIEFARPYLRPLSCMDGRQTGYILGAPGAEVGMFVIAMHNYLAMKGSLSNLTRGDYDTLLTQYFTMKDDSNVPLVDRYRPMTMHTDMESLKKILIKAKIWSEESNETSVPEQSFNETAIGATFNGTLLTKAQKNAFLDVLIEENAELFGCGHIYRLLSTYDFPFSKPLVVNVVKGVLSFMFNNAELGHRIQLQVLRGSHRESAVVWMESQITENPCRYSAAAQQDYLFRDQDMLPMFAPKMVQRYDESKVVQSVLVLHEQAIDFRMHEWSLFFDRLAAVDAQAAKDNKPLSYFTSTPDAKDFKANILKAQRLTWQRVKSNAFAGCVSDHSLCFNFLPQYKVVFKRVYDPEYQTIASVIMILSTLSLWFLLWRCYSRLDKGEALMPNMQMVDKLFTKAAGSMGALRGSRQGPVGAYIDESEPMTAAPAAAAAAGNPENKA